MCSGNYKSEFERKIKNKAIMNFQITLLIINILIFSINIYLTYFKK
jgi:hypothetical protein